MKRKIIIPILLGLMLFCSVVLGSVTLTAPVANAELQRGATYTYTATNVSTDINNCTFAYKQWSKSWVNIGSNLTNGTSIINSVPDDFGTFDFKVNCTNSSNSDFGDTSLSVSIHTYEAGEAGEAITDMIVKFLSTIYDLIAFIAIVVLIIWGLKKTKPMRKK